MWGFNLLLYYSLFIIHVDFKDFPRIAFPGKLLQRAIVQMAEKTFLRSQIF